MNPHHPRVLSAKMVEISPMVLKKILKFVIVCLQLPPPPSPLGNHLVIHLNYLHHSMLFGQFGWNWSSCSWEEDYLNFLNIFSVFYNYLPLKKGVPLPLNKHESLIPSMLCAIFGWNWPNDSREDENLKSYRQTDDWWQVIRKSHLSFQLR